MKCPQCRGELRKQIRMYLDLPANETKITKALIRHKDVEIVGVVDGGNYYCETCGWYKQFSSDETTIRGTERIHF